MRVIAGHVRGHRIKHPRGAWLRPTSDRVKEALFSILGHDLTGFIVLDLFAGTGNLTIEALSRGASRVVLVDSSARAGQLIRANLRRFGFTRRAQVVIKPVRVALRSLAANGCAFDLICLDPPYDKGLVAKVLSQLADGVLLREGGVVVAEHSPREEVSHSYGDLRRTEQRRYGETVLSFFMRCSDR